MLDLESPSEWSLETWAVVVQAIAAVGTLLAVAVAVWATLRGRADADERAEKDRAAFAERQLAERRHERLVADARWRLDLLLRASELYERALLGGAQETYPTLKMLVRAYPGNLPVLRAVQIGDDGKPFDEVLVIAQRYGPIEGHPADPESRPRLVRHELDAMIGSVRTELLILR